MCDTPNQLPVTFVNREPRRIGNEVKCLELIPQYPTLSTVTLNAVPSVLTDSAYGVSKVLIENRRVSYKNLDS